MGAQAVLGQQFVQFVLILPCLEPRGWDVSCSACAVAMMTTRNRTHPCFISFRHSEAQRVIQCDLRETCMPCLNTRPLLSLQQPLPVPLAHSVSSINAAAQSPFGRPQDGAY